MKRISLTAILAAAAATAAGLVMITMAAQSAQAQIHAGGQRRLVTDGSGNVNAAADSAAAHAQTGASTPVIYPAKGQSAKQQDQDRYECHTWARGQAAATR